MDPPYAHRSTSDPPDSSRRHRSRSSASVSSRTTAGTASILRNKRQSRSIESHREHITSRESSTELSHVLSTVFEGIQDLHPSLLALRTKRHRTTTGMLLALVGLLCIGFQSNLIQNHSKFSSNSVKGRKLKQVHSSLAQESFQEMETIQEPLFFDDFDQRRRRAADLPDGTIFTEPAHTRICRALLPRLDAYEAGSTSFPEVIFTESEYVCRDPDTPYTAIMNIMAAQLLATAAEALGLNIKYTHRCAKWEKYCSGNMTTVQFHLPDPISMQSYEFQGGCLDVSALRSVCEGALGEGTGDPSAVLFPGGMLEEGTGTCRLQCYFLQV